MAAQQVTGGAIMSSRNARLSTAVDLIRIVAERMLLRGPASPRDLPVPALNEAADAAGELCAAPGF
jgi:hypothetical protein